MNKETLKGPVRSLARFLVVGVGNTVIDFLVTNVLIYLFMATQPVFMAFIGFLGAALATVNSYLWNKNWTFRGRDTVEGKNEFTRFVLIAGLGVLVNTSTFLFCLRYFSIYLGLGGFWLINGAKLAAVATAVLVTFAGYRFGVFKTLNQHSFREGFSFRRVEDESWSWQWSVLLTVTLGIRLIYLNLTTFVFGDGVSYANVAGLLAEGKWAEVDTFWVNLFCWWEALLHLLPWSHHSAAIAASLIPGVLLVVPVAYIARNLYGSKTAWFAGLFCAVHPRLVEYSINGYTESLSLLLLATLSASLMLHIQRGMRATLCWAGLSLGAYVGIRNEGVVLAGLCALLLLLRPRLRPFSDRWRSSVGLLVVAASVIVVYGGLSYATLGTPALFQKVSNLEKNFAEQLDPQKAAAEAYGRSENLGEPEAPLIRLAKRFPRNLGYILECLPGILLSPILLFAFLLPELVRRSERTGADGDGWALGVLALSIFLVYPFIQVEPRLLFPLLIPVHIWGAAGLVALGRYLRERFGGDRWAAGIASLCMALMFVVVLWRGVVLEKRHQLFQHLAVWIEKNVPAEEKVFGGGYGYISNTGFLIPNPTQSRVWSKSPDQVVREVKKQGGRWLIIYEGFLRKYNPELLSILDSGLPGATKRYEAKDGFGMRSQVYQLGGDS